MPIYEYEVIEKGGCRACGGRFELRRPVNRPDLTHCPLCRKAVRKVITGVHTPKITKPISVAGAKSAGFAVYEKRDKGVYEKL